MSSSTTTQVRFKKSLDLKMKEIAVKTGKTKAKVYEDAILDFLEKEFNMTTFSIYFMF